MVLPQMGLLTLRLSSIKLGSTAAKLAAEKLPMDRRYLNQIQIFVFTFLSFFLLFLLEIFFID